MNALNALNKKNHSPLRLAVESGSGKMTKMLIEAGCVARNVAIIALLSKQITILKVLVEIDYKIFDCEDEFALLLPLAVATFKSCPTLCEVLSLLFRLGVCASQRINDQPAISFLFARNWFKTVNTRLFAEGKCWIESHTEVSQLISVFLKQKSFDRDDLNVTAQKNFVLPEMGGSIYIYRGSTLLHCAAVTSNVTAIEQLLCAGASCDIRDSHGLTPLFRIGDCGTPLASDNQKIFRLLLAKSNLAIRDGDGNNLFHRLVKNNNVIFLRILLESTVKPASIPAVVAVDKADAVDQVVAVDKVDEQVDHVDAVEQLDAVDKVDQVDAVGEISEINHVTN